MTKSEDFIYFFISFKIWDVSFKVPCSKSVLTKARKLYNKFEKKFFTFIMLFLLISSSVSVFFNSFIEKLAFSCSILNNFVYSLFVIKSVIKKYFNNSLPSISFISFSFFYFLLRFLFFHILFVPIFFSLIYCNFLLLIFQKLISMVSNYYFHFHSQIFFLCIY